MAANLAGSWKQNQKKIPLDDSVQIARWKEKISTEQRQVKHRTAKSIMSLKGEIADRNSYIDIFKQDDVVSQHREKVQNKPTFVFD